MGPKKGVKMHLSEFQADANFGNPSTGSWADDDTQDVFGSSLGSGYSSHQSGGDDAGYWRSSGSRREPSGGMGGGLAGFDRTFNIPSREPAPIPDSPPYTARLINLDYNATEADIEQLFPTDAFKVATIKLPKDLNTGRVKGFAFVDFEDRKSLEDALALDGTNLLNRSIKVLVAERREQREDDSKFDGDWRTSRRGPLPPLDGDDERPFRRGGSRMGSGSGGPGGFDDHRDYDNWEKRGPLPPRERDEEGGRRNFSGRSRDLDDPRDYDNWERKGPLPPREREDRFGSGGEDGGRRRFSGRSSSGRVDPDDTRNYDVWEHKGPLPPKEGEDGGRRKFSSSSGRARDDDDSRDYDNWERKGPLPPRREPSGFRGGRKASLGPREPREPATPADSDDDWRAHKHVPELGNRKRTPRTVLSRENSTGSGSDARSEGRSSRKPSGLGSAVSAEDKEKEGKKDKTEQLSKSFAVLSTEDPEDEDEDGAENNKEDASAEKPADEPTAAERALSQEASKEELESEEWETVSKKGRR